MCRLQWEITEGPVSAKHGLCRPILYITKRGHFASMRITGKAALVCSLPFHALQQSAILHTFSDCLSPLR